MQIKGAIFDVDGTLLDSMKIWDTVGNDYLLSLGIEPRENLATVFKNMSLSQSAAYYQTHYGIQKSEQEIIDGINHIMEAFYFERVKPKNGMIDLLECLKQKQVNMCIATATYRYLIEAALKRCGMYEYFSFILTCDEVGSGKDHPEIYEKALKLLGTEKSETVIWEDALYAMKTAKEAGFFVIGVSDESEHDQESVRTICDYYIEM